MKEGTELMREIPLSKNKDSFVKRFCEECKKKFETRKKTQGANRGRYCSQECRIIAQRKQRQIQIV